MSQATIELYNALIDAGVDKEKAERAAKAVVSREEAGTLATKADLQTLRADLYKALAVQTLTVIAAVVGLIQIL